FAGVEREVDAVDRTDRTLATDKANREGLAAHQRLGRAGHGAWAKARASLAHGVRPPTAIRGAGPWPDPGTSMWQAGEGPSTVSWEVSKGSTVAQHASAWGQRVWKRHPGGGLIGFGGSPVSVTCSPRPSGSMEGMAPSSARV